MQDYNASASTPLLESVQKWKEEGKSVAILAASHNGSEGYMQIAAFAIADPIRPEAQEVILWLQSRNVETWMITGDNYTTAQAVASQVGIPAPNVIASAMPSDKASRIEGLQRLDGKRPVVAMVGDGINDAPVSSCNLLSLIAQLTWVCLGSNNG